MSGQKAFLVGDCTRVDELGRWLVQGRAYIDIRLGDVLQTSGPNMVTVRVEKILSYHKSLDVLGRMMTGGLLVATSASLSLTDGDFLIGR